MIKPSIGRVVWLWQNRSLWGAAKTGHAEPHAAVIAAVHDDRTVNVGAFDSLGRAYGATGVVLLQDDDEPPKTGAFAEWMPFQKGQAARTEALERQVAGESQTGGVGHGG